MNKKGFTLVELLAVIAILAILVIIALPNVLKLYNDARKNAFLTEAKTLYSEVSKKYITNSGQGETIKQINNKNNSLDLTGEEIEYNFELDKNGNVISMMVSNGKYCISTNKKFSDINISDIKEECSYEYLHNIAGTLASDFYEKSGRTDRLLVSSIIFYNDGRIIDSTEKYDVSEEENGSIIMYVTKSYDSSNNNYANTLLKSSLLTLTIVSNGNILLPEDSSNLFSFYRATSSSNGPLSNIEKINFNCSVDTHNVKNMNLMFAHSSMYEIDFDCFDTSNVTDMSYMFSRYNYAHQSDPGTLNVLDLSSFNTSKVKNMEGMFYHCYARQIDGLNNFNTSNVTDMSSMFERSHALTLDLSSFDTSNVADMDHMFSTSSATTGYARTQTDADRFNNESATRIPDTLKFVVK